MTNWLLAKTLIFILRKIAKKIKAGVLHFDEILDKKFGIKRSEQIQEEIAQIMLTIVKQLRIDRK